MFAGGQYVRTMLDGEGPGGQVTYGPSGLDAWTGTFNRFPDFRQKIDAVLPYRARATTTGCSPECGT
ncbi:MAG: hypothetical protein IRY90_03805 [Actinomadura rubrobrunea]|nr:hypothetical protein [Actinomadura rubrobrunea]